MARYIDVISANISNTIFDNSQIIKNVDCKNMPWVDNSMVNAFNNCSNLVSVTHINENVTNMANTFTSCVNLNTITLTANCVTNLSSCFNGCTKLNYIKMMATDISASNCLSTWVNNVQTQSGTFVKNAAAEWTATGASGIPNNWTVETAVS